MEKLSQTDQICKHLEAGNTITPLEALSDFGCLRLAARIEELKKRGLAIYSRLIEQNGKRFAQYSMESALILVLALSISSCESQRHLIQVAQMETQYEHSRKSDPYQMERNWNQRPHGKTRLPFTQIYIY